jgi:hypothetical protein
MRTTRGSLAARLIRLEDATRHAAPRVWHLDEDGWLAVYERLGRERVFDREPDFPRALALYRDALARAHTSADPPFDPPPDFCPAARCAHSRRESWRSAERFPDLWGAFQWLGEMLRRAADGAPPVSEAEFAELAAWFAANDKRLCDLSRPTDLLDVGGGRATCCANVRFYLARGPRAGGAGRVTEDVRQLRARYGERPAEVGLREPHSRVREQR